MSVVSVYNEFFNSYKENPGQFRDAIRLAFEKSKEIDPRDGIYTLFSFIIKYVDCDDEQVVYMIDLGINPKDMDSHIHSFSTCLIGYTDNNNKVLRILLDYGLELHQTDICQYVQQKKFLDVLIERNIDANELIKAIAKNHQSNFESEISDFIIEHIFDSNLQLEQSELINLFTTVII